MENVNSHMINNPNNILNKVEVKQSSGSKKEEKSLFRKFFIFYNKKNNKIAKVLLVYFIMLVVSLSIVSFSAFQDSNFNIKDAAEGNFQVINSNITSNYQSNEKEQSKLKLSKLVRSSHSILLIMIIIGIVILTSPNYMNKIYNEYAILSYMSFLIFSVNQGLFLTYLNSYFENNLILTDLIVFCFAFIYILAKLKNMKYDVRNYLRYVGYFIIVIKIFICFTFNLSYNIIGLLLSLVILSYILVHCHVYFCLNYHENKTQKKKLQISNLKKQGQLISSTSDYFYYTDFLNNQEEMQKQEQAQTIQNKEKEELNINSSQNPNEQHLLNEYKNYYLEESFTKKQNIEKGKDYHTKFYEFFGIIEQKPEKKSNPLKLKLKNGEFKLLFKQNITKKVYKIYTDVLKVCGILIRLLLEKNHH